MGIKDSLDKKAKKLMQLEYYDNNKNLVPPIISMATESQIYSLTEHTQNKQILNHICHFKAKKSS